MGNVRVYQYHDSGHVISLVKKFLSNVYITYIRRDSHVVPIRSQWFWKVYLAGDDDWFYETFRRRGLFDKIIN